jgi:translation elongation factor EF-1beta
MEDKVEIANSAAEQIAHIEGISSAHVDDYNKYGNFQIVAYLELDKKNKPTAKNFNLKNINKQIKKILEGTKEISKFGRGIDSPKRLYYKYTCRNSTDSIFTGYEKSYIMIDFVVVLPQEQVSISELLI